MNNLATAFLEVARSQPHSPALIWADGGCNYAELGAQTLAISNHLTTLGLPVGSRVLMALDNSLEYVAALYALWMNRLVAVPMSRQSTASDFQHAIEFTQAALVIGDQPAGLRNSVEWRRFDVAEATSSALLADSVGKSATADDTAMIVPTSGTTGDPKWVMLSDGSLLANARTIAKYLRIAPKDRVYCVLPFHYSYGNSVLQSHLLSGASIRLGSPMAFPQRVAKDLCEPELTGFSAVPSSFSLLLNNSKFSTMPLTLRYMTQAGGQMPPAVTAQLLDAFPTINLFLMYGQTEATARLTYLAPEHAAQRPDSVGKPIDGVEIAVVNEHSECLSAGEVGQIIARGPNLMQGYWRNPSASQQTLKGGWLHTGDLGHIDEQGFLYITGRLSRQIKSGAHRINPDEIEQCIAQLPFVAEVVVVGSADLMMGEVIKVYCVAADPSLAPKKLTQLLKRHCKQQLPPFKMPKLVEWRTALPKTHSGKIVIHQLEQSIEDHQA